MPIPYTVSVGITTSSPASAAAAASCRTSPTEPPGDDAIASGEVLVDLDLDEPAPLEGARHLGRLCRPDLDNEGGQCQQFSAALSFTSTTAFLN